MVTVEDIVKFKKVLSAVSKEELIDIIAGYAVSYEEFENFVLEKIRKCDSADDVLQGFVSKYVRPIENNPMAASVFVFVKGGEVFLEKMNYVPDSLSKARAFLTAINKMDKLIENGLGFHEEYEFCVVDIAKQCMRGIHKIAEMTIQSGDVRKIADFKEFVTKSELSDGCICQDSEWEKIRLMF